MLIQLQEHLPAGSTDDILVFLNSVDLLPGVYEADLVFATSPEINPELVHVILTVEGLLPLPILSVYFDCTDIYLTWEMPPGSNPDCFNVYRDGELVADCITSGFCDSLMIPVVEYGYYVTAVYGVEESLPSQEILISFPSSSNLEPLNPSCTSYENGNMIFWDEPDACLEPDGYNLYRNDTLIETFPATSFFHFDPVIYPGIYEYTISAVYYFGESDAVLADCITGIDEKNKDRIEIYPNPVQSWLVIKSSLQLMFVEVFDNIGIKIHEQDLNGIEAILDLSNYSSGIYHLKITTQESNLYYRKIIVE